MQPRLPVVAACALVLAPFATAGALAPSTNAGFHFGDNEAGLDFGSYAYCEAFAPFDRGCGFTIVPTSDEIALEIPHLVAFSGTLVIHAEQNGSPVWNGSCIIPLGFLDTGIGFCSGENENGFAPGDPLDLEVRVGVYGYGWYGLRAYYD